ncbi:hypothetical protein [Caballeronia sordidicola]|nr:hypothetical protein [Caballeronia sordidicola]
MKAHQKEMDLAAGQVRSMTMTMTEANTVMAQRDRTSAGLRVLVDEMQRRTQGDEARAALESLLDQVR